MHITMRRRQMFLRHEATIQWCMAWSRRVGNRSRNIGRRYWKEKELALNIWVNKAVRWIFNEYKSTNSTVFLLLLLSNPIDLILKQKKIPPIIKSWKLEPRIFSGHRSILNMNRKTSTIHWTSQTISLPCVCVSDVRDFRFRSKFESRTFQIKCVARWRIAEG